MRAHPHTSSRSQVAAADASSVLAEIRPHRHQREAQSHSRPAAASLCNRSGQKPSESAAGSGSSGRNAQHRSSRRGRRSAAICRHGRCWSDQRSPASLYLISLELSEATLPTRSHRRPSIVISDGAFRRATATPVDIATCPSRSDVHLSERLSRGMSEAYRLFQEQ